MSERLYPEHRELFEAALRADDPVDQLSTVVRRLLRDSGLDREALLGELEAFREVLRAEGRDADEDLVLEVMDFLVGWASPHMKIEVADDGTKAGGGTPTKGKTATSTGSSKPRGPVPQLKLRVASPGTGRGIWTDRRAAAVFRDRAFPERASEDPTLAVLDLTGVFPTPGVLQDLVLPLAQRIRGGLLGTCYLVVCTHDSGVADFLRYLAREHALPLFVASSTAALGEAQPLGDLTSTEQTTLNLLLEQGGAATASELAHWIGLGPTAAGNRLVNLARKGFLYRQTQPRREGDLFVDPRAATAASAG